MSKRLPHIDLHGKDWERAARVVDKELNQAFCQEEHDRSVTFVTGRGAVLFPSLRGYLLEHPLVESIELQGGRIKAYLEPRE